jgi:hypothetical protein
MIPQEAVIERCHFLTTIKKMMTSTSTTGTRPTTVPRREIRWYSGLSAPRDSSTVICRRNVGV